MSRMTTSFAWLGLSSEPGGSLEWSDGSDTSQFINWNANYSADGNYVQIERSTGKWYEVLGTSTAGNICSKRGKQVLN